MAGHCTFRPDHLPVYFWGQYGPTSLCRCGWSFVDPFRDAAAVRVAARRHAGILDPR